MLQVRYLEHALGATSDAAAPRAIVLADRRLLAQAEVMIELEPGGYVACEPRALARCVGALGG